MSGGYDWWAEEGRPEHLRYIDALGDRMFNDSELGAHGIVVFSSGVDFEREILQVEVAAPDATQAAAFIRQRYGDKVEVDVVAPAEYIVQDVAWECWTVGATAQELFIWLVDHTDGSGLTIAVAETIRDVAVTLRGPRYQGAVPAIAIQVKKPVPLRSPLGSRTVVDGATGEQRPQRRLHL